MTFLSTVKNQFMLTGTEGTIEYRRKQEEMEQRAKRERAYSEAESTRSRSSTGSTSKDFSNMPVTNLDASPPATKPPASPDRPSSLNQPNMMNMSMYGSLEHDLRSEELASPLETTMSSQIKGLDSGSNKLVLNSLYSAMGGGTTASASVCSTIGGKQQQSPEHCARSVSASEYRTFFYLFH